MVNPFRSVRRLQCFIGVSCPSSPPLFYISFIIPVSGVLPVVLPAVFAIGDSMAVFVQFIYFPAFHLPLSVLFKQSDSEHDMEVGISVFLVMDREIRTHTGSNKGITDERAGKPQLFLPVQFYRQGNLYLTGKLCVTGLFNHLHTVPESAAVLKFRRSIQGVWGV